MKAILPIVVISVALIGANATQYRLSPDEQGNYRWRYLDTDGQEQVFVFEPGTKIGPRIVARMSSVKERQFSYEYTIGNDRTARQSVVNCFVEVIVPTRIASAVLPGWFVIQPTGAMSRAGWFAKNEGIAPGSELSGFQLESAALPGVTQFRCRGTGSVPSVPSDLPANVRRDLEGLLAVDLIVVMSIGPMIDGSGSPGLLLRRILRNYRSPLLSSAHPKRQDVIEQLERVSNLESVSPTIASESLQQIKALLATPLDDTWTIQLTDGLARCLTFVMERLLEAK